MLNKNRPTAGPFFTPPANPSVRPKNDPASASSGNFVGRNIAGPLPRVTAPPVYRPQMTASQLKPPAPPVYQPQIKHISAAPNPLVRSPHYPLASTALQSKQQNAARHFPPPYQPRLTSNPMSKTASRVQLPQPLVTVWSTVQRASEAKLAPASTKLSDWAKTIHDGDFSRSTTGIARLKGGTLVAATMGSVEAVKKKATEAGIELEDVMKTLGAGYHCEVSLYITYGAKIEAMGASQGFCPHCQAFLKYKGITMEGSPRLTPDQVWRSPEFYNKTEVPADATYPWVLEKDPVSQQQVTYKTMKAYAAAYKAATGDDYLG